MFQKYDIRGIYPKEINEGTAKFFAKKFFSVLKRKKLNTDLFIAQDLRKSSINLVNSILENYPGKAEYLGILPAPLFYHFCIKNKRAGIFVTASHLSKRYNGFKFLLSNNKWWRYLKKIPKVKYKIKKEIEEKIDKNLYKEYLGDIKKFVKLKRSHLFNYEKNGSPNIYLFEEIPNEFKNIKISKKAKIKLSSDFDGDRIEFYYKNKKLLPEEVLFAILKISDYKKIGVPIYISKKILDIFKDRKFYFVETGHYNFKKAYEKYNLDFGIETSFHICFFKEFKTEAPILAFFKLLEFDEKFGLDKLKDLNIFVERSSIKKELNLKKLVRIFKNEGFRLKKFDGYYFYKDDCRIHIRESSTEKNLFRINIDADSEGDLLKYKRWCKKII
jgi:phosphomannomutase